MKRTALVSLLCFSLGGCGSDDGGVSTGSNPEDTQGSDDASESNAEQTGEGTNAATTPTATAGETDPTSASATEATASAGETDDPSETTGDTESDTDTGEKSNVPEFGATLTVIGTAADGLSLPRDLAFSPMHPDQLWTANTVFHGMIIFFNPGEPDQVAEEYTDPYGAHFMSYVSSFSFAPNNFFGSCQESRDDWNGGPQPPDDFMGPTLWDGDLSVFATNNGEGSHMDMLHQSPLCMGIAHQSDNIYWAFDGMNGHIVRYDFLTDHGPGGSDHSDGTIRRYLNATVTRVPEVPGHMVYDEPSGNVYVADTGAGRVMMLDTTSGSSTGPLSGNWDGVSDYSGMDGATWTVVVDGLDQPSGLEITGDGRFFVSDHGTGEIIAFDMGGTELGRMATGATTLMGITLGPNGKLWYADGFGNEIVRVDP